MTVQPPALATVPPPVKPSIIVATKIPADLPLPGAPEPAPAAPTPKKQLILPASVTDAGAGAGKLIVPSHPGQRASGLILPAGFAPVKQDTKLVLVSGDLDSADIVGAAKAVAGERAAAAGPAAAKILTSNEMEIARRAKADIDHDRLIELLRSGQVDQALAAAGK